MSAKSCQTVSPPPPPPPQPPPPPPLILFLLLLLLLQPQLLAVTANKDMVRLYKDLLFPYNRLIRPVRNNSDMVTVKMGLRLSQLIDVNMKHQIMSTSVWVDQEWTDYQLSWNPAEYGGTTRLYVRSEDIWLPDIVLYNNADGNYEITIKNTKAELSPSGIVKWSPPAVYKSYCQIDVEWFPFDEQNCILKFGSWTYDDHMLDLQHAEHTNESDLDAAVQYGIDLQDYYLSVEWEVMKVPAQRHKVFYYSCCKESLYIDISFNITLRRKTVFYTVNLIIPCVGISCLTILVFYLPAESGEKVTLCISILLSLTVFVLLLAEIIPPSSLTVPLLGKYLLFTMVLVTLSVVSTICVLNIGFRSPSTHRLSVRTRWLFMQCLPPLLLIRRPVRPPPDPLDELSDADTDGLPELEESGSGLLSPGPGPSGHQATCPGLSVPPSAIPGPYWISSPIPGPSWTPPPIPGPSCPAPLSPGSPGPGLISPGSPNSLTSYAEGWPVVMAPRRPAEVSVQQDRLQSTLRGVRTIASRISSRDSYEEVEADWHYVAMVLDRLFLWVFTVACVGGACGIMLQAPLLYDYTTPIDRIKSGVVRTDLNSMGDEDRQL